MKTITKLYFGAGLALTMTAMPNTADAQLAFFNNQGSFQTNMSGLGNSMFGFENFETGAPGAPSIVEMSDPLNASTNNAMFSTGSINQYLTLQSNMGGANSSVLNARGAEGLLGMSNQSGYSSRFVVSNIFADSLDLRFSTGMFGIGGKLIVLPQGNNIRVDVYDTANSFLGSTNVPTSSTSGFWGVTSTVAIGRLNLFNVESLDHNSEGMDNIEMWSKAPVPEPATMAILASGAAVLLRRRKK